MSALYGEVIAEHYRSPRNKGAMEKPDAAHEAVNPLCGDRVRIELRVQSGAVEEARFRGDACMVATASASLLTERLRGMALVEASCLSPEDTLAALHTTLRPARVQCALLPLEVLRGALAKLPHAVGGNPSAAGTPGRGGSR